jgi:hypothetical protein
MRRIKPLFTLVLLPTVYILTACVLPASTGVPETSVPPTEMGPKTAYTAAAETLVSQLTSEATLLPLLLPQTFMPLVEEASVTPVVIVLPNQEPISTEAPTSQISADSTATATVPLATFTATIPPAPTYPPSDLGIPTWHDPLTSGVNWPLYEDAHSRFVFKENKLFLAAKNLDWWDGWMLTRTVLKNFYLEANFKTGKCGGSDRYGLVFRQGYLFGLSCDGKYSLKMWNGVQSIIIQDWTLSDFINKGGDQINRLRVKAEGNKFSLFANGNLLGELSDPSFQQGQFGFFVGAMQTPNFEVAVDQVATWELP